MGLLKMTMGIGCYVKRAFPWEKEKEYRLAVRVKGNHMTAAIDGKVLLEYEDNDNPYLYGCIGTAVREGSHCSLRKNVGRQWGIKKTKPDIPFLKQKGGKSMDKKWTEFIRFQNEELKRI